MKAKLNELKQNLLRTKTGKQVTLDLNKQDTEDIWNACIDFCVKEINFMINSKGGIKQ